MRRAVVGRAPCGRKSRAKRDDGVASTGTVLYLAREEKAGDANVMNTEQRSQSQAAFIK